MKELYAALSKAQGSYKPVARSGVNTYFNDSKYSTLNDFISASVEALSANGLSITQDLNTKSDGKHWLTTTLAHFSGESKSSELMLILNKQDMQSFGSASTYGRRYAYAAIAGLAPEDDDGNASVVKPPNEVRNESTGMENATLYKGNPFLSDPPPDLFVDSGYGYNIGNHQATYKFSPSDNQIKRLWALVNKAAWTKEELNKYLLVQMDCIEPKNLNKEQYKYLCDEILNKSISFEKAKTMPVILA